MKKKKNVSGVRHHLPLKKKTEKDMMRMKVAIMEDFSFLLEKDNSGKEGRQSRIFYIVWIMIFLSFLPVENNPWPWLFGCLFGGQLMHKNGRRDCDLSEGFFFNFFYFIYIYIYIYCQIFLEG